MLNNAAVRSFLRNTFGVDIIRYSSRSHPLARRAALMKYLQIDMVFDVGANAGQYGRQLRSIGYRGGIHSFEPQSAAYSDLINEIGNDKAWAASNIALGRVSKTSTINIAGNSYSSSLNRMLSTHLEAAPASEFIGTEVVEVKTLDSILATMAIRADKILLKVDTQGSEMDVLEGAQECLPIIDAIQLEMSLVPLYENDTLFLEMSRYLTDRGFELVGLEPGFTNQVSGRMLQVDGIFHRRTQDK